MEWTSPLKLRNSVNKNLYGYIVKFIAMAYESHMAIPSPLWSHFLLLTPSCNLFWTRSSCCFLNTQVWFAFRLFLWFLPSAKECSCPDIHLTHFSVFSSLSSDLKLMRPFTDYPFKITTVMCLLTWSTFFLSMTLKF